MEKENDLVSVVIATHNPRRDYFKLSLQSICNQTYSAIEIIIVDDGSDIDINAMVKSFKLNREWKIIKLDKQSGLAKALNVGIKEASGTYIARLDDDDMSAMQRIEKEVKLLKKHPEAVCVFTGVSVIDEMGETLYEIIHKLKSPKKVEMYLNVFGNPFCHSSALYLHKVIDELRGYNTMYTYAQDYELWLRFCKKGDIYYIPEPLTLWRSIDGKKSIEKEALQTAYCEAARYDAYLRNRTLRTTVKYVISRFYSTAQIVLLKSRQNLSTD